MTNWGSSDATEHVPALRRYARSLALDPVAADDLVQQALLLAYESRASFKPGSSLRAWLFAILHNQFISGRRRAGVEQRALSEIARRNEEAVESGAEHAALLRETADRFAALPEGQRSALHLVAIEGLSYQEAAATLNVAVGTIMSRLSRARATLREAADRVTHNRLHIVGGKDVS
ncbi:sigma-70 family RNA polymerase sigma factor [Sphingomonas sp.]|uniref:sigma-70 family RNA polymerase sigma factor n=1 Tax=Sphingomonas sp. TaxID=28214 RepID=UPI003B3BBCD4